MANGKIIPSEYRQIIEEKLAAEINYFQDYLKIDSQISPLDLFEVNVGEYDFSNGTSKDLVVIRPRPQIFVVGDTKYVLPSSDGFGPNLAYAFSVESLLGTTGDQQDPDTRDCPQPLSLRWFYKRVTALGLSPNKGGCRNVNVAYGALLDEATHSPIEQLSEGERPVFCFSIDLTTPVTHSVNLFRYGDLKRFRKHKEVFDETVERHGDVQPICVVEYADGPV